jgi:hypothetical protein
VFVTFTHCFTAIAKPPFSKSSIGTGFSQATDFSAQNQNPDSFFTFHNRRVTAGCPNPMLELDADSFVMTDEGDANQ